MRIVSSILLVFGVALSAVACGTTVEDNPSQDGEESLGKVSSAFTRSGSVTLDQPIRLANGYCLQDRGATVTQELCSSANAAQRWRTFTNANGTLTFRASASGRCLDVPGWSNVDGADLQTFGCNGGSNQQFRASTPTLSGRTIQPSYNNMCLDIEWGTQAGQKLQQFGVCHANANQRFFLPPRFVASTIERCSDGNILDVDVATGPRLYAGDTKNFDIPLTSNGEFFWWCYHAQTEFRGQVSQDRTGCPSGTSVVEIRRSPPGNARRMDVFCFE